MHFNEERIIQTHWSHMKVGKPEMAKCMLTMNT